MGDARSPKLIVTSAAFAALTLLGGCSSNATAHSDDKEPLMTADGNEIGYQSVRCIYRQNTGSDDTVSLEIQYLDTPDTVAFALYLNNPKPARPFTASPRETTGWHFEVAVDGTMYTLSSSGDDMTLHLDALPAPSTLEPGQKVRLHGTLDVGEVTLSRPSGGLAGTPLELAAGSVPVNCEASYDEPIVLD